MRTGLLQSLAMTRRWAARRPLLLALLGLLLAAGAPHARAADVTVFAASSLTDAFTALAHAFERARPGTHVVLNFAASSTLATQVLQGAPADVFASADERQMARVVDAGLVDGPATPFAANRLVVVARPGAGVRDWRDLARPGLQVVLAAPEVPAGRYAERWMQAVDADGAPGFARAVAANVVSREPNVRQTAAKVALGVADAAVVYATDARGLPDVEVVPIPAADQPPILYPIARLRGAHAAEAAAFVRFVGSDEGRRTLAAYGFAGVP